MVFSSVFVNNTIFVCFFFFFLITIGLYFLITADNAKSFNRTTEFVISKEIPNKETKTEIETHPVTTKPK